jgi:hypothetical protein
MVYSWSPSYVNAVLESDPTKLAERISEAEQAMFRRAHDAELGSGELQAMQYAAVALQNLRESLTFRDSWTNVSPMVNSTATAAMAQANPRSSRTRRQIESINFAQYSLGS